MQLSRRRPTPPHTATRELGARSPPPSLLPFPPDGPLPFPPILAAPSPLSWRSCPSSSQAQVAPPLFPSLPRWRQRRGRWRPSGSGWARVDPASPWRRRALNGGSGRWGSHLPPLLTRSGGGAGAECHTLAFKIRPESSYVCPGSPHIQQRIEISETMLYKAENILILTLTNIRVRGNSS